MNLPQPDFTILERTGGDTRRRELSLQMDERYYRYEKILTEYCAAYPQTHRCGPSRVQVVSGKVAAGSSVGPRNLSVRSVTGIGNRLRKISSRFPGKTR